MSDPSTLLLITCAACNQAHADGVDSPPDNSITTHETSQKHQQVLAKLPEMSPPEAVLGIAHQGMLLAQNGSETNINISPPSASPTPPELSTTSNFDSSILRLGSKGEAVIKLQRELKQLGYYQGTVDGVYGSFTYGAVSQFQQEQGLTVDGVTGNQTWSRLQNPVEQSQTPIINESESITEPFLSQGTPTPETDSLAFRVLEPETISPDESFNLPILDFLTLHPGQILLVGWAIVYGTWWIVLFRDANTHRLETVSGSLASVAIKNNIAYSRNRIRSQRPKPKPVKQPTKSTNQTNSKVSKFKNTNSTYQGNGQPRHVSPEVASFNSSVLTNPVNSNGKSAQNTVTQFPRVATQKSLPPAPSKLATNTKSKVINKTKFANIKTKGFYEM